jgi:hypothetical protein
MEMNRDRANRDHGDSSRLSPAEGVSAGSARKAFPGRSALSRPAQQLVLIHMADSSQVRANITAVTTASNSRFSIIPKMIFSMIRPPYSGYFR